MVMMRLLLFLFGISGGTVWASPPSILVLGDSLSAAYGIDTQAGWANLLQQRLAAEGFAHRVVNASISGETTEGGRARLPGVLEEHRPATVIIALGGNDGLRGLPLTAMRANLQAMIRASREQGAQVLLAGVRLPPNYGKTYTGKFQQVFRELAAEDGVASVPRLLEGVAGDTRQMQTDGMHPRANAQVRILDNLWPALRPLLEREAPLSADAPPRPAAQ